MLYREMKKTGDELSILGFGCMRLPQKKGSPGSGKIDEARATRQILHAIEQGVNYFDTAMPYHMGGSEPFLGRAIAGGYRGRIKLAKYRPRFRRFGMRPIPGGRLPSGPCAGFGTTPR